MVDKTSIFKTEVFRLELFVLSFYTFCYGLIYFLSCLITTKSWWSLLNKFFQNILISILHPSKIRISFPIHKFQRNRLYHHSFGTNLNSFQIMDLIRLSFLLINSKSGFPPLFLLNLSHNIILVDFRHWGNYLFWLLDSIHAVAPLHLLKPLDRKSFGSS